MNDTTIQRTIGVAAHQHAVIATCRWANLDEVTAEQLQTALQDVRTAYQMTTPLSATVKLEYLIAIGTSKSDIEVLRDAQASTFTAFAHTEQIRPGKLGLYVMHEPEVSRRLVQHQVANLLQHIDQPAGVRPGSCHDLMYFDSPPASGSRILSPEEFEVECDRAAFVDILLLRGIPKGNYVAEQVRQSSLEVTLAAQCYRREYGQLPETLSELVSHEMLPELPGDPWGVPGAKLLYERDSADFSRAKVWSVGANRVDDGGKIDSHEFGVGDEGLWIGNLPATE